MTVQTPAYAMPERPSSCPIATAKCGFTTPAVMTGLGGGGPGTHSAVYRCDGCGVGVTMPSVPDVSVLYEGRESLDFSNGEAFLPRLLKSYAFERRARSILKRQPLAKLVIDYACGDGVGTRGFVNAADDGATVIGADFFDTPPSYLDAENYASFARLEVYEGQADIVTCFHALEHDEDPDAFIERLRRLLRPGGLLMIEVPNVDCVWTPWFGRTCENWYLPYHRLHFTREALGAVLGRGGFEAVTHTDICGPTISRSIARTLGVNHGSLCFALGVACRPAQLFVERLTRRPSALRAFARRPSV